MGTAEDHFPDDDFFSTDAFLSPNQTFFTGQPVAYPTDDMLAFSQAPAFPSINPLQLQQLNPSQFQLPDELQWPHRDSGLGTTPSFADPGTLQTAFSTPSAGDAADTLDDVENAQVKLEPAKKRSVDWMTESPPKKGRRGRKSKAKAEAETNDEGEEAKRDRFLERNRVAASKCRQKKKAWTNQLEEKARELTKERQLLTATVAVLKNELLELKCKCLEHSDCRCNQIRDYLQKTVAGMSPTSAVYTDPTLLDRRPSQTTTSSFDDGESMATSRRPSCVGSNPPSPALASDFEARVKTILDGEPGSVYEMQSVSDQS